MTNWGALLWTCYFISWNILHFVLDENENKGEPFFDTEEVFHQLNYECIDGKTDTESGTVESNEDDVLWFIKIIYTIMWLLCADLHWFLTMIY